MKKRRSPRTSALFREVISTPNGRTIRIATYPATDTMPISVTFGIGYGDPDSFSKIFAEIDDDVWNSIQVAMKKALKAREQLLTGSVPPKPKRKTSPKTQKPPVPAPTPPPTPNEPPRPNPTPHNPSQPPPATAPGLPGRRRVGSSTEQTQEPQ